MPTPRLPDELAQDAVNQVATHGGVKQAAEACGVPRGTLRRRYEVGLIRGMTPRVEREFHTAGRGESVLAIPDLHCPFQHEDAFDFLAEAKKKLSPSMAVCLGDEVDQHALSQYTADPDGYSAGHEHVMAMEGMGMLKQIFPVMGICTSNHTVRYLKRAFKSGIPSVYMREYKEVYEAPAGWAWDESFLIDGVRYFHGEPFAGKDSAYKAAVQYRRPCVIGHIHSHAGIQFNNNGDTQIWGMNAGCLIDQKKYAFKYAKENPHKAILGVGFVDHSVPHYFPMKLDKRGRWTGEL